MAPELAGKDDGKTVQGTLVLSELGLKPAPHPHP